MPQVIHAQLPVWASDLFRPKRYKVYYGGRGAARSWSFARTILLTGAQRPLRVLCCREFQKSIADSVHKLLVDQIALMNLGGWKVQKSEISHVGTGTTIIFEGLRYNTNRVKSLEGIDICWVEEAESVSKDSWEILIPTIRKPGSEIWISFNPDLADDPTYVRFVVNKPPNAFVEKVGWEDNPWFPDTLAEERDYLYPDDQETAEHVWGGHPRKHTEAQILAGKYRIEAFTPRPNSTHWLGPFYGADFGFAEDAQVCIECWIRKDPGKPKGVSQGDLMIYKEAWKLKQDIHKIKPHWHKIFGPKLHHRTIMADSSRPETISYLKQHGLRRIRSVFKWAGSIEDGVGYLRSFENIIIHPRCKHVAFEARHWSFKVDRLTQEILPQVVDKHNHCMDAIRYALSIFIRMSRKTSSSYSGSSYSNAT